MNELTEQEAERCARACGWKKVKGVFTIPTWEDGKVYYHEKDIAFLDPHFWFGWLWDRLDLDENGLAMFTDAVSPLETAWCVSKVYGGGGTPCLKKPIAMHEHPCLALCEAIEKIQESHGSDSTDA